MDPEHLRSVPLFETMSEQDLRKIATFATEDSAPAGATLMREGDYANDMVAIEDGTAEVLRDGRSIGTLGPGDVFGEMALLDEDRRTATVTATAPMRLLVMTGASFRELDRSMPSIHAAVRDAIEQRRTTVS